MRPLQSEESSINSKGRYPNNQVLRFGKNRFTTAYCAMILNIAAHGNTSKTIPQTGKAMNYSVKNKIII